MSESPNVEQVVFPQTVEGLVQRALKGQLTPRLRERLAKLGVDVSSEIKVPVPRSTWAEILKVCAEEVYPEMSQTDAFRTLGEKAFEGFGDTFMGKALFGFIRLAGPKRLLSTLKKSFRSANNYSETKLTELGPNQFELWLNEVNGNPGYMQGVVLAGLRTAGAKQPVVEPHDFDGHACVYRCSWSE